MVVCPRCNLKHDDGNEFCRECESFLMSVEDPAPEEEKPEVRFFCSRCRVLNKEGNYCPTCGSLLMRRTVSGEAGPILEKKSVKTYLKKCRKIIGEEKELESCMSSLQAQRDKISAEVLNSLFLRYKDRLESLSPLHQEIETQLESIRKRASEEIADLKKGLKSVQDRFEEFRRLNKSSAVTKSDFLQEKKELKKEIKSREKCIRTYRQIVFLLSSKTEESMGLSGDLFRPFSLATSAIIILMAVAAYLLWPQQTQPNNPKDAVASPSTFSSPTHPPAASTDQGVKKIDSVFENIRQANLEKDIDLFISCFSRDFPGMEGKRHDTLRTWQDYDYLNLAYLLKKQKVSGDTASVTLEWLVRISKRTGGRPQEGRTVLDVTLKREGGLWKIKEIKPLS